MTVLDKLKQAAVERATGEDPLINIKRKYAEAKTAQVRYLSVWELNRAFYSGDQWVYWNKSKLERPVLDPESSRVLVEDNRITGIVRTEISKMTKMRPTFSVIPTTAEQADTNAAQVGEKVLKFLWKHLHMRIKLESALMWSRVCGSGFWKVTWDSAAGKQFNVVADEEGTPIMHPDTGAPMLPEHFPEGLPEGAQSKMIATGDVSIQVVSPFEIFPDPLAKTMDECEWIIQVSVQSKEYIKKRWNKDLPADTNVTQGGGPEAMLPRLDTQQLYKGVRLFEFWEKPSSEFPNGRHVVWAKDVQLESGDNPYKRLPYVMFRSIPVPGRFFASCIVEHLRGPQTELNKVKSQIVENAQRIGNPAVMISKTSNTKISGVPGEEIVYDDNSQNSKPEYLRPPDMPSYVIEQINRIEQSMQEISGQHEVSQAQVPPGVKAASAINLLQEADDTRLGPGIYDMEEALGDAGTLALEIIAQYWTDERVVLIAGANHQLDSMSFKGAALRENTKAEVQTGSMLPQSKAARQAAIQDFLGLAFQYEGAAPIKPGMLAKILEDLDAGALAKMYGDFNQDEGQVNRENQQLSQGKAVKIHVYDNQAYHIEAHTEYQKTVAYQNLDPTAQAVFEFHVKEHREHFLAQIQPPQETEQTTETTPQDEGENQKLEQGQEQHEQKMGQAEEAHAQKMSQAEEAHAQKLEQQKQQSQGKAE